MSAQLAVEAEDKTIVTDHGYTLTSQASDFTITNVLLVPANSEVPIQLAGINRLQAVYVSSDQLFDVALKDDSLTSNGIYTGVYSNNYFRQFSTPTLFDRLLIKASTVDATIKITCVGLGNL